MKKRIIFTVLFSALSAFAFSQIEISNNDIKTTPVYKPKSYDSLSPFNYCYKCDNVHFEGNLSEKERIQLSDLALQKYIGQTIYFVPSVDKEKQTGCQQFYDMHLKNIDGNKKETSLFFGNKKKATTTPLSNLMNLYKVVYNEKGGYYTPKEVYEGKYFKIIDIEAEKNLVFGKLSVILETEGKDTVRLKSERWGFVNHRHVPNFILSGYYEKQKQLHVGKEYVVIGKQSSYEIKMPDAIDINSGEQLSISTKSVWTCSALKFLKTSESVYYQLYLIFTNSNNQIKVLLERNNIDKNPVLLEYFMEKEKYLQQKELEKLAINERQKIEAQQEEQKRIEIENWNQQIIKKYGDYYGKLIIQNRVVIGMSSEMCKLSWGSPEDINTTIVSGLNTEQWVYSLRTYLYFENGKLTAIQK